jgi:hypothetical protein
MKRRFLVLAALALAGSGTVLWYLLTHRIGDWVITVTGPRQEIVACFKAPGTILRTIPFGGSVSWKVEGRRLRFPGPAVHTYSAPDGNWKAAFAWAGVEEALCRNGAYPDPRVSAERAGAAAAAEGRRVLEIQRIPPVTVDLGKEPNELCDYSKSCTRRLAVHLGSGKAVLQRRPDGLYLNGHKLALYRSAREWVWDARIRQNVETAVTGFELKDEMLGRQVVNANVLDALVEHPELVPDEWRTQGRSSPTVVFWGTVYKDDGGSLFVRHGFACESQPTGWCTYHRRLDNHCLGSAVVLEDGPWRRGGGQ